MRKSILMLLLAILSSNAMADWAFIERNEYYSLFVDGTTIRKTGNLARMWALNDYRAVQVSETGKRYKSTKIRFEYDCDEARARQLSWVDFSGNMGEGNPEAHDEPSKWQPYPPGSLGEALKKLACGQISTRN